MVKTDDTRTVWDGLEDFNAPRKLKSQTEQKKSEFYVQELEESPKLRAAGDPVFIEYKLPFTVTPYYDYLDNFLLGYRLETRVTSSSDCIEVLVYSFDDYSYFQNNITDYTRSAWEAPIMNFTRAMGGNFSYVPINCYLMVNEMRDNVQTKFESFDTLGDFFLAFLFNMMGNALRFR